MILRFHLVIRSQSLPFFLARAVVHVMEKALGDAPLGMTSYHQEVIMFNVQYATL